VATGEHMMLHVDTKLRKASPMEPYMLNAIVEASKTLTPALQPKGLGLPFEILVPPSVSQGNSAC